MNITKATLTLLCAALVGAPALPAAAAPLQIIAVKVRVESQNGPTHGDLDLGDTVAAQIGERLKVSLVGTGIINGAGQEVAVNARFNVAAGGANLGIVRTGPSWVVVSINGAAGNGLGQLAYVTTGNYQIKPGLAGGRITFRGDSSATGAAPPPQPMPQGEGRDRLHQARAMTAMLYRAILGEEPSPNDSRARADVDRIDHEGYGGLLTVAAALARAAEERGLGRSTLERGYQERDVERVGALYRDLLHRQESNRDLWEREAGFRGNVQALHERGLAFVVSGLVDSDEFRSSNQIGAR